MAKLVLCKGVELEPNYEHTFDFENSTQQGEYFQSKAYKTYNEFLRIKDKNTSLLNSVVSRDNYDYVKVPEKIEEVRECTYMFFQEDTSLVNPSKIYYAFITNSYYVNDECSIVEYEIDVMQTFLFDYSIESAYISREHQDRLEKTAQADRYKNKYNILPENLNLGEDYIIHGNQKFCQYATFTENSQTVKRPILWCVITATDPIFDVEYQTPSQYIMNNNLYIYVVPFVVGKSFNSSDPRVNILSVNIGGTSYSLWSYQNLIYLLTHSTNLEKIHQIAVTSFLPNYEKVHISSSNVITFTSEASNLWQVVSYTDTSTTPNDKKYIIQLFQKPAYVEEAHISLLGEIKDIKDTIDMHVSTTMQPSIDYETKLKTYPYSFMQLTHNNQSVNLKYELVKYPQIYGKINIYGAYSFLVYNKEYAMEINEEVDNDELGYNYGIASKSINDLPLTSDAYLNYMLTKSAQAVTGASVKAIGGLASVGAGIGMLLASAGNPITAVAGVGAVASGFITGAGAIANEVSKREDLKNTPPSIENMSNDGTFSVESKTVIPIIQYMEIKPEYKEQCYAYFRLFGYQANRLATPSYNANGTIASDNMRLKSRYYYNYIKCADISLYLPFNRNYHDKIVSIYRNGITFWHYRTGMNMSAFAPFNYRYENIETSLLE